MNSHVEVLKLLPWFVNGTLNEREQSMVNDHLLECSECNREVKALLISSKLFHAGLEPSADSFARARSEFLLQLNGRRKATWSRRWMIPATMAACLVMAAVLIGPVSHQEESFGTLGKTQSSNGHVIQLVFQPNTREKSIRSLVLGDQGRFISGPTAQGVYRLELPLDTDPQWVLQRLRNHPDVQFAELEVDQ